MDTKVYVGLAVTFLIAIALAIIDYRNAVRDLDTRPCDRCGNNFRIKDMTFEANDRWVCRECRKVVTDVSSGVMP